jgi:anaerobic selenocysteine-containing dehydrogenase
MRSPVTGIEQIGGLYPTNTLAEEVLTDHPHRIRALWVESSNPANTAAGTARVEEAIRACELSVVVDIAYTETAELADYILPAAAQHEKWEFTLFNFEWPTNYFHLRRPLFEPLGDALPESEIYARLFEALHILPGADVLAGLAEVAAHDRAHLLEAAMKVIADRPELGDLVPVLLYRTLGPSMPHGAAHVAPVWKFSHRAVATMPQQVRRALGSAAGGFELGEELFHAVLDNPSGVAFSTHHYDEVWSLLRTDRIQLAVPELLEWITALDPDAERPDPDYPFSLLAGQRRSYNANQILRAPGWRKADHDGALWVHPDDLTELGLADGEWVAVVTPTGRVTVRAEANDSMRRRQVALPHGFGMSYPDEQGRVTSGPRLNLLTTASDRDPIAGTPHHKDVPVRIERATLAETDDADATSKRVRALVGVP